MPKQKWINKKTLLCHKKVILTTHTIFLTEYISHVNMEVFCLHFLYFYPESQMSFFLAGIYSVYLKFECFYIELNVNNQSSVWRLDTFTSIFVPSSGLTDKFWNKITARTSWEGTQIGWAMAGVPKVGVRYSKINWGQPCQEFPSQLHRVYYHKHL